MRTTDVHDHLSSNGSYDEPAYEIVKMLSCYFANDIYFEENWPGYYLDKGILSAVLLVAERLT